MSVHPCRNCGWEPVLVRVNIPANLSHTRKSRWVMKPVDACIAPIVKALVAGGVLTSGSCCGHGEGAGSILLQDGRELRIGNPGQDANPC